MSRRRWLYALCGCLALGLVLLIFPEAYQRNMYFDLSCGRMERRVEAFGRTISREPVDSPVAGLYEQYVGALPGQPDWRLCYSGGYNIYGGKVICYGLSFGALPGTLNSQLPPWFDDANYPDGPGVNYTGITDAAKGELLLRILEAARRDGHGSGGRKYLGRAARAVLWLDHPADVADLPPVSEVLDDKVWKEVWEPLIGELETANRTKLEALCLEAGDQVCPRSGVPPDSLTAPGGT